MDTPNNTRTNGLEPLPEEQLAEPQQPLSPMSQEPMAEPATVPSVLQRRPAHAKPDFN